MSRERLIGSGRHALVWLCPDSNRVRKLYTTGNPGENGRRAQREYDALRSVDQLLRGIPGVRVPAPYSVDRGAGVLEMEYSPGIPMYQALADTRFGAPGAIRKVASDLAWVMTSLADNFPLDLCDLSLRNTLYEVDRDELVLIDFTPRTLSVPPPAGSKPISYLLGNFLAGALTIPLHRKTAVNWDSSRRILELCGELTGVLIARHDVEPDAVRLVAWSFYWHRRNQGGILRRLWFGTGGALVFGWMLSRTLGQDRIRV